MSADLHQFHHGVTLDDVWAGRVGAGLVIQLTEQLQLNVNSRCRMIRLGGDTRWIGWDVNSELAATQYDLIGQFAAGDKFTEADRFPRPGLKQTDASTGDLFAPDIASFNVAAFMAEINK